MAKIIGVVKVFGWNHPYGVVRVVIPKEAREKLKIKDNDKLIVKLGKRSVIFTKDGSES